MRIKKTKSRMGGYALWLIAATCPAISGFGQTPASPQLWYLHNTYLTNAGAVQSAEAVMDKALQAGYTGVALWDSSLSFMSAPFWPAQNVQYLQQVIEYAGAKGLKVMLTVAPYGYSNDALQNNPNWAESQRVVGTRFQVDASGTRLNLINSFPGVLNSDLSKGRTGWFDLNDAGVGLDTGTGHNDTQSAFITNAPNNARLRQAVTLTPWRQYRLHFWYKTAAFHGAPTIYMFDNADFTIRRLNSWFTAQPDTSWTEVNFTFNSEATTAAYLYMGIWGGSTGTIWFDDIQIEETDLVYVTRRSGTPVKVYDPYHPAVIYQEGVDYNYIADAQMNGRTPFQDAYHTPTTVTLLQGTHLAPGQTVAIDSYAVAPVPGTNEVGLCLTEPGVQQWSGQNAKAVAAVLPPGGGYFLQYDEMRQMNSCGSCRAKNMTAGQLLAWHAGQTIQTYEGVSPGAPLYVWSDMFDPFHNAVDNYYQVEGTLSGSWQGLPANVTVMNWNLSNLKNSLTWFSGRNAAQPTPHAQIIAGYYDSGDGSAAALSELAQAAGVPGVMGLMYTTWNLDYTQLGSFAAAAKANWAAYAASVTPSTPLVGGTFTLVAQNSGLCLDIRGGVLTSGGVAQQYPCSGATNQEWRAVSAGDGSYEILSVRSGLALDVSGGPGAVSDGIHVQQWTYLNGANQHWTLTPVQNGAYNIIAQNSGKCLDVAGGPAAVQPEIQVQQWSCKGGTNQQWKAVPVP